MRATRHARIFVHVDRWLPDGVNAITYPLITSIHFRYIPSLRLLAIRISGQTRRLGLSKIESAHDGASHLRTVAVREHPRRIAAPVQQVASEEQRRCVLSPGSLSSRLDLKPYALLTMQSILETSNSRHPDDRTMVPGPPPARPVHLPPLATTVATHRRPDPHGRPPSPCL
jgi:hypothetical protein